MYNYVDFFESMFGSLKNQKLIHLIRDPLCVAKSLVQKRANRDHYKERYASHYWADQLPLANRPFSLKAAVIVSEEIQREQIYYSQRISNYPNVLTITYESLTHNYHTSVLPDNICATLLQFIGVEWQSLSTSQLKTGVSSGES